ncbi:MAG: hypothetical protein JWO50_341 [Candidatus Kaiserbacteria bacterium]|nr:hypothetical protein [Candidatus Kaiserbacteria bacterium]
MNPETADKITFATRYVRPMVALAFAALGLYLLMLTVNEFRSGKYIGSGVTATNTIVVSGTGDVTAVPTIASFSYTVDEKAKDVATAQTQATKKTNDIIAYLKDQKIDDKDIQTTDYSVTPNYEYTGGVCVQNGTYCPPGKQVLVGYEVSQSVTVKVRDTTKAGDILAGIGSRNPSYVSGLTFTVDDETALQSQAREKAIANAKTKADALASQLGVSIVRVVGFSEDGNQPRPISYMDKTMSSGAMAPEAAVAPAVPTGENKYTSNVSITYEIK